MSKTRKPREWICFGFPRWEDNKPEPRVAVLKHGYDSLVLFLDEQDQRDKARRMSKSLLQMCDWIEEQP